MQEVSNKTMFQVDLWGLILSSLCIVHCLLTPIFLLITPSLIPHWLQAESDGHQWFYFVLLIVAGFSIVVGYRQHSYWQPALWLTMGLAIVGFATFFLNKNLEYALTIFGSLFLLRGHYLNRKKCRLCQSLDKKPVCCR